MSAATLIYITISVIALIIIGIFLIIIKRKRKDVERKQSGLTQWGMLLTVLGIIFGGSERLIGYAFIGAGVLLAVMDLVRTLKVNNKKDEKKKKPRDRRRPQRR